MLTGTYGFTVSESTGLDLLGISETHLLRLGNMKLNNMDLFVCSGRTDGTYR